MRPWESELGRKKGKRPSDLPSLPSITEVGFERQIECLSPSLSSTLLLRCLLASCLLVTKCSTNERSCVAREEEATK